MPFAGPGQSILWRNGRRVTVGSSGPVYDAAATAYFAAMSVQPTDARKTLLNDFIVGLKADGVWSLLDYMLVMAAHDAQAGLVNIKNPAQVATATAPTFTVDRGYTGGASSVISTGIADNSGTGNWARDSATLFTYVNQAQTVAGGLIGLTAGNITRITGNVPGGSLVGRIHSGTALNATALTSTGFIAMAHTAAAANVLYRGGTADVTDATGTSTAPTVDTFTILKAGATGWSDAREAVAGWGGGLNGTLEAALYNRINTLLTAIGAA